MRKLFLIILYAGLVFMLNGCKKDKASDELDVNLELALNAVAQGDGLSFFTLPESDNFSNIPQDSRNELTSAKVKLGQLLYHETALGIHPEKPAGAKSYSCASCHFAEAGFQAGRVQGIGEGGVGFGANGEGRIRNMLYQEDKLDVQPVRSPSVLNTAYQELMLWNGQFGATGDNIGTEDKWVAGTPVENNQLGFEGLETQAIAGLSVHRMGLDMDFINGSAYKSLFDQAFPDLSAGEKFSLTSVGLAIAAYERTLLSNQAPFQRWLKGELSAMSEAEKNGAISFFTTGGCGSCHTGPSLSSMRFEAYGMNDLYECGEEIYNASVESKGNLGRGGFTGLEAEKFAFKVPQLYNLKDSPFYGHGSSFRTIESVVRYKNEGSPQNNRVSEEYLSEAFRPLNLSAGEVENITAFIENALYDPNLERYKPEVLPSGLCFPFNDPVARNDIGCE